LAGATTEAQILNAIGNFKGFQAIYETKPNDRGEENNKKGLVILILTMEN
jgi:hypothetical protein